MPPTASRDWPAPLMMAARLVAFGIVCAILWWAQAVLIPIALAGLLTFLVSPLVMRLDRYGVPRVLGVLIIAAFATGIIGGLGYVVAGELGKLAAELPAHRTNIRAKISDLRALTRGGAIENVQETIEDISQQVGSEEPAAPAGGAPPPEEPVRVAVEPERQLFGDTTLFGPVLEAIATAGLTILLAMFMLVHREDLRNRLVSLAGQASLVVTTKAFAEAGQRISRYLLMQFVINATMGIAVGIGLAVIGVPYAALWGLSAAVLRYIPYIGPWIAALLPITISIVTAPGWQQVMLVVALFVTLELLSNNVMEPWLYGHSVGLSSIAVIVAAIFWTWLWGPIGLVIATPMTACLVVLSRYIPELGVLDRLLSERPALQRHLWLYQRLLARDEDEAEDIVEKQYAEHGLEGACDLVLGTLLAVKRDLAAGRIPADEGELVVESLSEIVDDLPVTVESEPARRELATDAVPLLGLPAHDKLDEVALQLLAALLREKHCTLEVLGADLLVGELIAEVEKRKPVAVCIPSLPPSGLARARHVCKRLHARTPDLKIVIGRLNATPASPRTTALVAAAGAEPVAYSLAQLRDSLVQIARALAPHVPAPAAKPDDDAPAESAGLAVVH